MDWGISEGDCEGQQKQLLTLDTDPVGLIRSSGPEGLRRRAPDLSVLQFRL
ncbi:hypothetical protein PSHI_22180 [Pseudomonas sp. URMO17WK12:I11]|jgi:hypothetical protein|nr:hypothetical protein PSHI_22180 [Pseudomonas sp. URMO17WK12:I11]